ncbi:MAG: homoserine kinase [Cyanobacteria bacterium J007]|nr:MAG: homoserine kinase [Cyanobacteria bacterium J007]
MIHEVFPVIYSTLNAEALVDRVLACYPLDSVRRCQFWHRGLSDVYVVETSRQMYVLRVSHYHWRSKSEIDFELELLDFLDRHHLPVAAPLTTIAGDLSVTIAAPEGDRYAALFPYAPGTVPVGDFNPTQSFAIGETLAKIHQICQKFRPRAVRQSLTPDYLLEDALEAIAPFLKHRPHDLQQLREAIGAIEARLAELPQHSPFWTVCWGDPHSGNVHFTPSGQMTLFDFDQCGYGWRAFDIAKFWQVSLRAGTSKAVRQAFLEGYQGVEPLSQRELDGLQSLTQMAHLWMWSINLHNARLYNYSRLDESYFTQRLEHLKLLRSSSWQLF